MDYLVEEALVTVDFGGGWGGEVTVNSTKFSLE